MSGRVLSILAVAAVIAVAAAAAVDSWRGDEPRVAAPGAAPAAARTPQDCLDREACRRGVRELVIFYRACVQSWNDSANRGNQATVVAGAFDAATLFRSTGGRCTLYFVAASGRILLARRVDGEWSAVGGGRRPPAADDFRDSLPVGIRYDGTLALRSG